jgi:aldehyde:ferredoxin oxidoreductase
MKGVNGRILEVHLSTGAINVKQLPEEYYKLYLGGRGLGMKLLYDYLPESGADPLGDENPLMFMPGLFCGFPIPSSSRTCMVTKSPLTSTVGDTSPNASTVSYSNMGGFIGAEIKFAGYDGIVFIGRSSKPVYLFVENDTVELRDATKFWGMGTNEFDEAIIREVGDRRFESAYIGPGAENGVLYGSVINTAARAAGRGGTGCIMGNKKLKAIVVRGSGMAKVAEHKNYLDILEKVRLTFGADSEAKTNWRYGGTANALQTSSDRGSQAVKNFSEGTFTGIENINAHAARKQVWNRDFACFSCPLACKKSGFAKGAYGGVVNEGIEYETGTMLGANLMIDNLNGLNKLIEIADDYGIDIISLGNVIGFLMECYEKNLVDIEFLDGIDLKWGSVDASMAMIHKIGKREGIGDPASKGVKYLAKLIGKGSSDFAIHVKGHELAAWNVQGYAKGMGVSYTTANRGACHMTGGEVPRQNHSALRDSLGACSFAASFYRDELHYRHFVKVITGFEFSEEDILHVGERVFNLERMLNCREGFSRLDDILPERFYKDAYTLGPQKGVIVDREEFRKIMDDYYTNRQWAVDTGVPGEEKLKSLQII